MQQRPDLQQSLICKPRWGLAQILTVHLPVIVCTAVWLTRVPASCVVRLAGARLMCSVASGCISPSYIAPGDPGSSIKIME